MKNEILSIVALLASLSSWAQITYTSIVNENGCGCYSFNVPASLLPAYQPGPNLSDPDANAIPGFSYLWVWGDGTHTYTNHPTFNHCFGPSTTGPEHTVELHFTPRKRPRDPAASSISISNGFNICLPELNEEGVTALSVSRDLKDSGKFLLIVDARSCSGQSIFTVTFDGSLFLTPQYPQNLSNINDFSSSANDFSFSQNGGEFKRYYVSFQCKDASQITIPSTALFTISRVGEGNGGFIPNKDSVQIPSPCEYSNTLIEQITSGPFDPNHLVPSLGTDLSDCNVGGKRIHYTIQFQNEGNGPTNEVDVHFLLDNRLIPDSVRIEKVWNYQDDHWTNTPQPYYYEDILNSDLMYSPTNGQSMFGLRCKGMILAPFNGTNYSQSKGYITFSSVVRDGIVLGAGDTIRVESKVVFKDSSFTEAAVHTNEAKIACNTNPDSCCTGKEDCCCSNCCKPNYWKEIVGGILAFLGALALYWFKFRKK